MIHQVLLCLFASAKAPSAPFRQGSLGTCWFVSAMAVVAASHTAVLRLFRDLPLLHALRVTGVGGVLAPGRTQLGSLLGSPAELREFFTHRGGHVQAALLAEGAPCTPRASFIAKPPFTGDVVDLASIPLSPLGAYQVRAPMRGNPSHRVRGRPCEVA